MDSEIKVIKERANTAPAAACDCEQLRSEVKDSNKAHLIAINDVKSRLDSVAKPRGRATTWHTMAFHRRPPTPTPGPPKPGGERRHPRSARATWNTMAFHQGELLSLDFLILPGSLKETPRVIRIPGSLIA